LVAFAENDGRESSGRRGLSLKYAFLKAAMVNKDAKSQIQKIFKIIFKKLHDFGTGWAEKYIQLIYF